MRISISQFLLIGLVSCVLCGGCDFSSSLDSEPIELSGLPPTLDHGHDHVGPHGGQLIDMGRSHQFHAEILDDHDTETTTIYIVDSQMSELPIEQRTVTLTMLAGDEAEFFELAAAQSVEQGKWTQFESDDKRLFTALNAPNSTGKLRVTIDGTPYVGSVTHQHGHKHEGDDALVWQHEGVQLAGFDISLGHHAAHLHAGQSVEPAVSITREGQPIADARVFNSLVAEDGKTIVADEAAMVYEPPTADEPAHYAQGALQIPRGIARVIIRFRIVLPAAAGEDSFDVDISLE